jgi:hypothetical protein
MRSFARTPLVFFAFALLALGCGGHALDHDAGAGAGGATGEGGAGGALGGGFFFTVGCQLDFSPCGGDVVGTWRSDPKCKPMPPTQVAGNPCPGETFALDGVATTATWTFAADQTFTILISAEGQATINTPLECLVDENGRPVPCTGAGAGSRAAGRLLYTGGVAGSPMCKDQPTECDCTVPYLPAPFVVSGTYTTSGTTMTLTLPGGLVNVPADFCVSGDTLDLGGQSPLLPKGDFLRQ